jgi:ribosome-binding ATPase YchF (GTP1/OBG family)
MNAQRKRLNMGDIDEISQALGSIQSDVANVKEHVKDTRDFMAAINLKLGDMNTQYVLMSSKVDAAHSRLDEEKKIREHNHSLIQVKVDKHDNIISKALWIGSGVVAFITTAFTVLLNVIPHVFGKLFP